MSVTIDQKEFNESIKALKDMEESIDSRWIKNTLRRKAKPIKTRMQATAHSSSFVPLTGITTAKKRSGEGIKVGIIKNDPSEFPTLSAPALASVLEYGTPERFRQVTNSSGIITGRASTGSVTPVPWIRKAYDSEIRGVIKDFEKSTVKRVEKNAR